LIPERVASPSGDDVTRSTGNVFEDLGFPQDEPENLRVRSILMGSIRGVIETEGLNQARAAKLFGVSQPRISDLCVPTNPRQLSTNADAL
jgi:predicted XRE-type DNA-binding protein